MASIGGPVVLVCCGFRAVGFLRQAAGSAMGEGWETGLTRTIADYRASVSIDIR